MATVGKKLADVSVSLKAVMRVKLRSVEAKTDIVAAIFDGRLPLAGRSGDNLSGLLISKSHLDEFILHKRRIVENNTHSFQEVSNMTGLDQMVVSSAIEKGLLSAIDREGRCRVPAESVVSFNANYLLLKTLASFLEANTRSLTNLARKIGVPLIELARPAGGSQPILRKESKEILVRAWQKELRENEGKVSREEQLSEKHIGYETALECYLEKLSSTGGKLPRRAGRPNKVAIAKACGFEREVLYNIQNVVTMLEAFDQQERSQPEGCCMTPHEKLSAYVESMAAKGLALPRLGTGRLNMLAISKASGVHRNVFYSRPELMALLES